MNILAIETSCDDSSVAVIRDGKKILSNVVASQTEFHKKYGGIVPEIASRKHIEVINPLIQEALDQAKVTLKEIDAIAVTYGPGLVGSLLVGLCAAKALAFATGKPLIGVNHLEGHIYANFLNSEFSIPHFPFICLIVSGGHTSLVLVKDHGKYAVLGQTRDDAAGEAFDKVARFLGLGHPGGPIIDKLAKEGDPHAIKFPRSMQAEEYGYDFSFSGVKTAVVNYVQHQSVARLETSKVKGQRDKQPNPSTIPAAQPSDDLQIRDIVASFQQAVIDTLVDKTIKAAKEHKVKTVALAGGVAANSCLRENLKQQAAKEGLEVLIPPILFCTDNAAMIGCAGYFKFLRGEVSDYLLAPIANLRL